MPLYTNWAFFAKARSRKERAYPMRRDKIVAAPAKIGGRKRRGRFIFLFLCTVRRDQRKEYS
jgi:hypothetical protein